MNKRPFGNTGKMISEIGFGAWQLGDGTSWSGMDEATGIALVLEALERGMNFFDTAPIYGGGSSEIILGKALKGKRDKAVISTKFGQNTDGSNDFSPGIVRKSLEDSLRRLQMDYVDSFLIHGPYGEGAHFEILEKLKDEGKIHAYGASVDHAKDMFAVLNNSDSGVLETMFNIFWQGTAEAFALAREKKVALIIKVPLDSGWLSGKYNASSKFTDVRKRWSTEEIEQRFGFLEKIRFIQNADTSMTQAALRFILSYPEVSTVIPGVKNSSQLRENISAGDAKMPAEQAERLRKIWRESIRDQPMKW